MKKVIITAAVLWTVTLFDTHALGIGVQGQFGAYGMNHSASLLISPTDYLHGAINWYFFEKSITLGGSLDFWFLQLPITMVGSGDLLFFVGAGLYAYVALGDQLGLGAGPRLPIGLDLKFERVDVFLQLFPQFGIGLLPSFGIGGIGAGAALGARFWF